MTASALAPPLAVIVVPSSGSKAMSIRGPWPVPTFSPIYSIGASSRSPSPITTVPSIVRLLRACRIASTAAWSAAFSSPRPISRDADKAAASVTRTASSARLRSILELSATLSSPRQLQFCGVVKTTEARRSRRLAGSKHEPAQALSQSDHIEVHQQANPDAAQSQIGEHLRFMDGKELFDGFDL